MVVAAVATRTIREPAVRQSTTPVAVGASLVSGALGFPFAPFPSLISADSPPRRASLLIAPIAGAVVLMVCTMSAITTGVPMARTFGLAAATLLSSIFIAVPPMDGSKITGRLLNLAVSAGLLVVALAYGIPLV